MLAVEEISSIQFDEINICIPLSARLVNNGGYRGMVYLTLGDDARLTQQMALAHAPNLSVQMI